MSQFYRNGKWKVPDKQILRDIAALSKRLGRSARRSDWDEWKRKPCWSGTITNRFGTWEKVLERVGLVPQARLRWPPRVLIAGLEKAVKKLGRVPGVWTLFKETGFTTSPFLRHWGGVREACRALERFRRGEITREQLLAGRPRRLARRYVSASTLYRLLKRDRHRCVLCKRSPATEEGVRLEADHIKPVCLGGSNGLDNLRTLCRECHVKRTWGGEARGRGAKGQSE